MKTKTIKLAIVIVLLGLPIVFSATNTIIGFQGRVLNISDNSTLENGTLQINISTTNSCDGAIYSETFNDPFDDGIFDVMLGETTALPLNYDNDYYICTVVNGEQVSIDHFRPGIGEIDTSDIDITDFKSLFVPYVGATGDVDLGSYRLDTTGTISGGIINANTGLYNNIRADNKIEIFGVNSYLYSEGYANFSGIVRSNDDLCVVGLGCLSDIYNFWFLGETKLETNYDTKINGDLTANSYCIGLSCITSWDDVNGSIWTENNGVVSYDGNLNVAGNATIGGKLTVGNMEMSGSDEEAELSYSGFLNVSTAPSVFNILVNTTLYPGYPFYYKAYVDPSASSNVGVLITKGDIGTFADNAYTQLIEGIRFVFSENSPIQTQGTRKLKSINNEIKFSGQSGGTYEFIGLYNKFDTVGNPSGGTRNVYGAYNDFGAFYEFAGGTPTYNEYGYYSKSVAPFTVGGATINRYGLYLTGYTKSSSDNNAYAIYVNDGTTYLGGDLQADSNTLSNCAWEGDATTGAICSNGKIMAGYNASNNQLYCCEL